MNNTFFVNNRKKYVEKVEDHSLSLFFSGRTYQQSADHEFDFEVDKNFYYLTGINKAMFVKSPFFTIPKITLT
jgi:Xaa-Pro aminopeptidase